MTRIGSRLFHVLIFPVVLLSLSLAGCAGLTGSHGDSFTHHGPITPDEAAAWFTQGQRLQQLGAKVSDSVADEHTRSDLTIPFTPGLIEKEMWTSYGITVGEKVGIRVVYISYPNAIPGSKIRIGDEVLAVDGISFDSTAKLESILKEIQKKKPAPAEDLDILAKQDPLTLLPKDPFPDADKLRFRFRRGDDEWEEDIPVMRIPNRSFRLISLKEFKIPRVLIHKDNILMNVAMAASLKTDDELAFVICHALAHVRRGHEESRPIDMIEMSMFLPNPSNAGYTAFYSGRRLRDTSESFDSQIWSPYSKAQEEEADKLALSLMHKSGFDVKGALEVMCYLMEQEGQNTMLKVKNAAHRYELLLKETQEYGKPMKEPAAPSSVKRAVVDEKPVSPAPTPLPASTSPATEKSIPLPPKPSPREDGLGTITASGADPKSAGIYDMGLSDKVSNLLVSSSTGEIRNIFFANARSIYWYGRIDQLSAFTYIIPRKVFSAKWYAPDGKLFYEEKFGTAYGNTGLTRTALKFKTSPGEYLMGRWRVTIWKNKTLIDDRYFLLEKIPK